MEGSFIMANEMMKNRNNDNMMDQLSDWFSFPKDFFDDSSIKNIMQSDVAETDKDYIVKVDMPGMDKKDIKVSYKDGILNVSALVTFKEAIVFLMLILKKFLLKTSMAF